VGGAERVARACTRWRTEVNGVGRCWTEHARRALEARLARGHRKSARVWQMRARGWSNACAVEQCSAQQKHGKAEASA
jgi:hypothetical protein